jgi:tetratricopeptide (TPR) repeat protein
MCWPARKLHFASGGPHGTAAKFPDTIVVSVLANTSPTPPIADFCVIGALEDQAMHRASFGQFRRIIIISSAIVSFALPVGAWAQADPSGNRAAANPSAPPAKPGTAAAPAAPPQTGAQLSQQEAWCSGKNGASADQQIAACTALLESDKLTSQNRAKALRFRGNGYFTKQQHDLALRDYDQAIRLDPKDATPYWNRGNVFNVKGRYDQAIQEYDQAIKLNPGFSQAFFSRALAYQSKATWDFDAYLNEGRYEDLAIKDYSEAIRLNPKGPGAYNNRGNIHLGKRQYQDAIASYDEAIRLDPNSALYLRNRAGAYRAMGEYDRAIADYQKALTLKGDEALKKLIVLALSELGVKA